MSILEIDPLNPFNRENIHTFLPPLDVTSTEGVDARAKIKALAKLESKALRAHFQSIVAAPIVTPPTDDTEQASVKLYRTKLTDNALHHIFRHHADNTYSTNWAIPEHFVECIDAPAEAFAAIWTKIEHDIFQGRTPEVGFETIIDQDQFSDLTNIIVESSIPLSARPKKPRAVRTVWSVSNLVSKVRRGDRI